MIPEASTLIEKFAETQYSVITEAGRKQPYTFERLFKIPKEYTVDGQGEEFLEYYKSLEAKGKEINIRNFLIFFKKEIIFHSIVSLIYDVCSILIPLLINVYLSWLGASKKNDSHFWDGCLILGSFFLRFSSFMDFTRLVLSWRKIVSGSSTS